MTHFFIAKQGEQKGPFSLNYIADLVLSQEYSVYDHIYLADSSEWVRMKDFQPLIEILEQEALHESSHDEDSGGRGAAPEEGWYILIEEQQSGPFSYQDLLQKLQKRELQEYHYVWNAKLDGWQKIAELEEFSPESIKALKPEVKEAVYFRRRHLRSKVSSSLLIHNNEKLWRGESLEISAGGAGVIMEHAPVELKPGSHLYLHYKPSQNLPAFNAICEVVSLKPSLNQDKKQSLGLKFVKIHPHIQKQIEELPKVSAA